MTNTSNTGIVLAGVVMVVVGLVCSWINSFFVMSMINATATMWVLWWFGVVFSLVGMAYCRLGDVN